MLNIEDLIRLNVGTGPTYDELNDIEKAVCKKAFMVLRAERFNKIYKSAREHKIPFDLITAQCMLEGALVMLRQLQYSNEDIDKLVTFISNEVKNDKSL